MILKPFLRPVFVKLIEPDESFVSDIISKILSTDNGDYGNLSLVYLKNASEDKSEESETLKADFDINFIYKLLMQLYAVKNNKNIINSSKSYHVQNIQNNLNHYLKALSYIDNNLFLKLSAINKEINEIHADQIININEVISTLKKSSMINNNQLLNINRTVVLNGNYYNNEKNIAASNNAVNNYILTFSKKTITSIKNNILSNNNLNRRSVSNFTNLNLNSKKTEINNNNNLFNKAVENYTSALNNHSSYLSSNIEFLRNSPIKNNILRQKLFNEITNYRDINPIYGSVNKISLHSSLLKNINKYDDNSGVDSENLFHLGNSNYSYNFDLHRHSVISENGFVNNFSFSTELLKSVNDYNEVFNTNYNNALLLNKRNLNNNRSLFKFTENNLFDTTKASRINSDLSFRIINKILKEEKRSKKNFQFNMKISSSDNRFEILSGNNSLNNSFILETNKINSSHLNKLVYSNLFEKMTEINNNSNLFNKAFENYTDNLNSYYFNSSNYIQFLSYAYIKNQSISKKIHKEINDYREVNYKGGNVNKFETFLFNNFIRNYSLSKELVNDYRKADYKSLKVNRFQDLYFNTSRINKILQNELMRKNISPVMESLWSNIYKFNYSTTINNEKFLTERNAVEGHNSVNNYISDLNRNVIILKSKFANNVSLGVEALNCINKYNEALNFYSKNSLLLSNSNFDLNSSKSSYDFSWNNVWKTNRISKINSNLSFSIVNKILNEEKISKKNFLFNKQTYSNNNSFEISNKNRSGILSGNKSLNTYFVLETSEIDSLYLNKLANLNIVRKGTEINSNNILFNKEVENYTDNLNRYYFNSSNYIQFLSYASIKNHSLSKKLREEITKYREVTYKSVKVNKFKSFLFNDFIKNHILSNEVFNEINDYRKADYKGLKVSRSQDLYFNTSRTNKILQHELIRKNISPIMESLWSNIYKFNYSTINNEKNLTERNVVDNYIFDLNRNVTILKSKFGNNVRLGAEALKCINKYNEALNFYSKNSLFFSNSNSNKLLFENLVQKKKEVNNYQNNLNTSSEINKVLEAAVLAKDISLVWEAFDNKNYKANYNNINKASKINSNLSFSIVNKILKEEKRSKKNFLFNKQTYSNNNSFEISNKDRSRILSGNKSLNTYFVLETSEIDSLYLNKLANLNIVQKGTEINSNNNLFNKEVENYTDILNDYALNLSNDIQFLSYASIKNQSLSKKIHKEINDYREFNYKGGKVNKFETFLFYDFIKSYSSSKEVFKEINDYRKADYKGLKVNRFQQDLYSNTSGTSEILQNKLMRKNISLVMESLWSNICKFNYSTTINNEKNLTERKAVDKDDAVNNYIFDLNRNVIILKSKFANNVSLGIEALKCINKYNEALNFYSKNSLFLSNSNSDSSSSKSLYDFSGNNVWNTNRASKINSNLSFNIVNKILSEEKKSKQNFLFNIQPYSNISKAEISNINNQWNTYFILETSQFKSIHLNKSAYLNIVKKGNEINNENKLFNKEVKNYNDTLNSYASIKNHGLSKKLYEEINKYKEITYKGEKINKFKYSLFNSSKINKVIQADAIKKELNLFMEVSGGNGYNSDYNNILNNYSLYFGNNIKKILSNSNFNSQGQAHKWYYSQLLEEGTQHNYFSGNQIANNTNIIQDIILKSLILNKPIFKAVNNENTNNIINRKSSFNDINKIANISKAFLAYMEFSVSYKNTFDSDYFSFKNIKLSINKNLFNNLGSFNKLYNSEFLHSMTNNNHIKVNQLGSNANLYDMFVLKNQISRIVHFNNEKRLLNKVGALNQNFYEHKRNDFQADFNNDYVGYNRKKPYESNSEMFEETYKNKVNINHKRVQQANLSKEEKITDIERDQDREYIIQEKMKRFINETVEILIEDKFKKHDKEKIDEEKQIESISNKVIEKIDRQLKYEKRRRGLI